MNYDVIVIGGGHAGIEASLACARLNKKTLLVSQSLENIGKMPCNPSLGGPAKGIVVREIDALGGEMGKAGDATAIQFKMLNTNKGPGVRCLRVQSDKLEYAKYMQNCILNTPNLTFKEGMVNDLIIEDDVAKGVIIDGENYYAKSVILTTGTYMSGKILKGHSAIDSGPDGEKTTSGLSDCLRAHGIETFRLKTGTPARVYADSIDFSKAERQDGSDKFVAYSYGTKTILDKKEQVPCFLIHTTPKTHEIINSHLNDSAMYSGLVEGVGPRYCPSIEDKLVRFADKERHQLFLEPESLSLDTIYVQGFSTSMPEDVQLEMLHSLPGLENCKVKYYGYAIEYDAINPLQCQVTLENKKIHNLYTAGQINGTSGYEEAAAQGLMAGINACLKIDGKDPFVLRRDEAYIGVLIDDLVNKGTQEPYRLLTSRAEYRLLLRHDNADERLSEYGHQIGLLKDEDYQAYLDRMKAKEKLFTQLNDISFSMKDEVNDYLKTLGYDDLKERLSAAELLKRPKVTLEGLKPYLPFDFDELIGDKVEIDIKYAGYIQKSKREAEKMLGMDKYQIPRDIDYDQIDNLSLEAHQKLKQVQPLTIGQASRISGVSPADISVLLMYLKK